MLILVLCNAIKNLPSSTLAENKKNKQILKIKTVEGIILESYLFVVDSPSN